MRTGGTGSTRTSCTGPGECVEHRAAVNVEPTGRDWKAIGVGLIAAFALVDLYVAGVWAIWVIAEALI